MQQAKDFLEEAATLAKLLKNESEGVFKKVTQFKSWTINDVIGHLHLFDIAAIKSLESDKAFLEFFEPISRDLKRGLSLLDVQFPYLKSLNGRELFNSWWETANDLANKYLIADPKKRLKWAGPEMSAMSSITARQMETWAHGQEIFDCLGVERVESDRIKNICHLGVATYPWTFKNRKLTIPKPAPYVQLVSPSGEVWSWNSPEAETFVIGNSIEFAQVVTQVRNVGDCSLNIYGENARNWMAMAQCFAGKPEDPPPKGSRYKVCFLR